MFGSGISQTGELVDLGAKANVVEKSGTWFSYGGERLGQGRENARAFLKDNPEIAEKLKSEILSKTGVVKPEVLEEK
jgi:recombination protein RecA